MDNEKIILEKLTVEEINEGIKGQKLGGVCDKCTSPIEANIVPAWITSSAKNVARCSYVYCSDCQPSMLKGLIAYVKIDRSEETMKVGGLAMIDSLSEKNHE